MAFDPPLSPRRLFTPARAAIAGACLMASAVSGWPSTLYRLFEQLGSPRAGTLLLGAAALGAAALPGSRANQWAWVRALRAAIATGPARQIHHGPLVAAWSCMLFAATLGLAVTLWWEPRGSQALAFRTWLRAEDGFWETLGASALLAAGGLLLHAGLPRARGTGPRWALVCLGGVPAARRGGGSELGPAPVRLRHPGSSP